jgi:hypothetical protein
LSRLDGAVNVQCTPNRRRRRAASDGMSASCRILAGATICRTQSREIGDEIERTPPT